MHKIEIFDNFMLKKLYFNQKNTFSLKEKVYLCSRIINEINGKKTFEPPKSGFGRKEHDE